MKILPFLILMLFLGLGLYAIHDLLSAALGSGMTRTLLKAIIKGITYTLPYIWMPILLYAICIATTKNVIIRIVVGAGCIYALYLVSGKISLSFSGVRNFLKLSFQIYFLLTLLLPRKFASLLGGIVSAIGAAVIYMLPGLSGSLAIALTCLVLFVVFVYLNALALVIKKIVGAMAREKKGTLGNGLRASLYGG